MNAQFGLSNEQLVAIQALIEKLLLQKYKFSIFVFGSRATNRQQKYSDLDLWIETVPQLNSSDLADLRDAFQESDLPFTVDIVTPETCLKEYEEKIRSEIQPWFSR